MASPAKEELNLDLQLHCNEIHAKAPSGAIHLAPCGSTELKGVATSTSPWLSTSSTTIEGSRYTGSGINLNLPLPDPEKKAAAIPNNASPSTKTRKPYELPHFDLIGKKNPPPFAPVILESSEVAEAAADHKLHEFFHGAERCKNRVEPVGVAVPRPSVTVNMAPAKKRRRYIWPANKVAKLDAKIEQLRKEALLNPAHRRSIPLIQKDIDELQGKKDEIHARLLDMMMRDEDGGEGGSSNTTQP